MMYVDDAPIPQNAVDWMKRVMLFQIYAFCILSIWKF